jgi:ATP-dependent DNA helicase Rep
VIPLEQNYRSTGRILRGANRLIRNNPHLFEKRLWSELGLGDPIRVLSCEDERQEAEKVVSEILHRRFVEGGGLRDFAVLYRGNHQARAFEKALRAHGIPYALSGGVSFFARAEVKDLTAYLRLMANPDDDAAFLRAVNVPRREIGPGTLEKLAGYARQRGKALLPACTELGLRHCLDERACARLHGFADLVGRSARRAEAKDPAAALEDLVGALDYAAWLKETSGSDAAAGRRLDNVAELLEWVRRECSDRSDDLGLAALVNRLALMDVLDRRDEQEGGDRVHLMTLHAAKGLEFPHVFLVGVEEELLPHRTSIEDGQIEEERRLAYVGITRARRTLTLTLAERRKRGGELIPSEPSRFLAELPAEDLLWVGGGTETAREESRQRGSQHLAGLRTLLGADSPAPALPKAR